MTVHFLDDDYSTNRYHEITLSAKAEQLDIGIEFFDHPISVLEGYEEGTALPDLLFLDINMPVIDGWEFLALFNEKFPNSEMKCIILTTSNNPKILEQAKKFCNICDLAIKPLSPENFERMTGLCAQQEL